MESRSRAWAFVLIAAYAAEVRAQAPQVDSGVRLGEKSRLHARLDLTTLYDTNAFRRGSDDDTQDNWRLLVRPGLNLDVPGSSFAFGARGDLTLTQFLDDIPVDAGDSTRIGGSLGVNMRAGSTRSPVSLSIADTLTRTPVFLSEPEATAADEVRFPEWRNTGELRVTLRPGGRALEIDAGYRNGVSFFDGLPNSHRHLGLLEGRWKFLPKTAVVMRSDFGVFFNEANESAATATPFNVQVGLVGQLTQRIRTRLMVGYGNTLVWTPDGLFGTLSDASQETVTATALVTYQPSQTISVTAGYERSLAPLILLEGAVTDAFVTRAKVGIGRFVGRAFGSVSLRNFGLNDRFAVVGVGGASLDYYVLRYLRVGGQYRLTAQGSDDDEQNQDTLGDEDNPFVGDFVRHQVVVNVGVEY